MGGILSTKNSLKFGNAEGSEGNDYVQQFQENDGHIGGNQLTNNSAEFGLAKGNNVIQRQTNRGNIGGDVNFNNESGDYAKVGLPVVGYPILENPKMLSDKQACGHVNDGESRVPVNKIGQNIEVCKGDRGGDGGHSYGGGYGGPGGPGKGNITINHNSAAGKR